MSCGMWWSRGQGFWWEHEPLPWVVAAWSPIPRPISVNCSSSFDMVRLQFPRMRAKALLLTRYFEHLLETMVPSGQVSVITPRDPQVRWRASGIGCDGV